jgi:hypothetical protein
LDGRIWVVLWVCAERNSVYSLTFQSWAFLKSRLKTSNW